MMLKCPKCGYVWDWGGKSIYFFSCPRCRKNESINHISGWLTTDEPTRKPVLANPFQEVKGEETMTKHNNDWLIEHKCECEDCFNYRVPGYVLCHGHLYGFPRRMAEDDIQRLKSLEVKKDG